MDYLHDYFLSNDPLISFHEWFQAAQKLDQNPEAMTLTTLDSKLLRPSARTILFKGLHLNSLTFYTNYLSAKSRELEENNEACVVFYWHVLKRQVRIHGKVRRMEETLSKKYFSTRDRDSQLASLISSQSSPIEDKSILMKKFDEAKKEYAGSEIPCPQHWGGFLLEPYEFEFFLYGEFRINDRFLYTQKLQNKNEDWTITRLQP